MSQSDLTCELMSDFAATGFIFRFGGFELLGVHELYLSILVGECEGGKKKTRKAGDGKRKSLERLLGDNETARPALRGGMYK